MLQLSIWIFGLFSLHLVNSWQTNQPQYFSYHRFGTTVSKHTSTTTSVTMSSNMPNSQFFYSQKTFESMGLNKKMVDVLSSMQITKPSKVQALSFITLYSGKHAIVGDQTGSGKTFAYLLPFIQRLEEGYQNNTLTKPQEKAPYIIIMTPTTELAMQVSKVVKTLSNGLKFFRSACFISTSEHLDSELKKLRLGCEIVITTPGKLYELMKRKEISLNDLKVMILDEVDVLFADTSFPLQPIGEATPVTTQFVFTSATLPSDILAQITQEFPQVVTLSGPGLHRIAPSVEEILIDCSGKFTQSRTSQSILENKKKALLNALITKPSERTIIFCNTIDACRQVENMLIREDRQGKVRDIYPYHSAVDAQTRESSLYAFSRPLLKVPQVLICTDRASRGLDFDRAFVDHVILFDFPRDPSEYLRRVGRTGRAGRSGTATVLVYGKQVPAAKMVIQASIDGKKIEPTPMEEKGRAIAASASASASAKATAGTDGKGGGNKKGGSSSWKGNSKGNENEDDSDEEYDDDDDNYE